MFTESDYIQYFAALQRADQNMVDYLDRILQRLNEGEDGEITLTLKDIREDEISHLKLEQELFSLLE